jgi:hypothetical protein
MFAYPWCQAYTTMTKNWRVSHSQDKAGTGYALVQHNGTCRVSRSDADRPQPKSDRRSVRLA